MQNRKPEDCPSLEMLITLAEQGDRHAGYKQHLVHIAVCPECFNLCRDLRKAETLRAQMPAAIPFWCRRTAWLAVAPVAALLTALLLYKALTPPVQNSQLAHSPNKETPTVVQPAPVEQEPDKKPVLTHEPQPEKKPIQLPKQAPMPKAPPAPQKHVRVLVANVRMENGIFYEGTVRLPDWTGSDVRLLTKEAPLYRSGTNHLAPPVRLIQPDPGNRALTETKPVFEWTAPEEFDAYEVRLECTSMNKDSKSGQPIDLTGNLIVTGKQAQLKEGISLAPGSTCTLRIKPVLSPEQDLTLSSQLETACTFYILPEQERQQVIWAETNKAKAPLTSAMVFYRLQRYSDAAQVAGSWKQDKKLSDWVEAIRIRHEKRLADPGE